MPHWERKRWCEEISRINDDINTEGETDLSVDSRVDDVPIADMDELAAMFGDEDDE